jgi:hypothetical protein
VRGFGVIAYNGRVAVDAIGKAAPAGVAQLQFSAAAYSAGEGAGSATITVTRTGSSAGAVSVDYATADGTATAGADYQTRLGTLTFADGDTAPKSFTVPLVDDADVEPSETVQLGLSNPTGGAVLGTQASAVLTITDNDAPVTDTVWVGEGAPPGATMAIAGSWGWAAGTDPAPHSGSLALYSGVNSGEHKYAFVHLPQGETLPVGVGDTLVVWVYIDPAHPPREVMLAWQGSISTNQWEHRAYWGEDLFAYGTPGTAGRRYIGPLPTAGQWVRLAVPAALMGLEGQSVRGFGVIAYNGRVAVDAIGKAAPP